MYQRKEGDQQDYQRTSTAGPQAGPKMCPRGARGESKKFPLLKQDVNHGWKVLDGDGEERTHENEEDAALLRKAAAESIVLLKNDSGVLPIDKTKVKKVAVVGGNAKAAILSGGGSAALKPSYFVSPYDGIVNAFGKDVEVTYSEGARGMTDHFY